jgi:hypothetical protein
MEEGRDKEAIRFSETKCTYVITIHSAMQHHLRLLVMFYARFLFSNPNPNPGCFLFGCACPAPKAPLFEGYEPRWKHFWGISNLPGAF